MRFVLDIFCSPVDIITPVQYYYYHHHHRFYRLILHFSIQFSPKRKSHSSSMAMASSSRGAAGEGSGSFDNILDLLPAPFRSSLDGVRPVPFGASYQNMTIDDCMEMTCDSLASVMRDTCNENFRRNAYRLVNVS
jgi:hypothetical protein